jgi:hypothetical protein
VVATTLQCIQISDCKQITTIYARCGINGKVLINMGMSMVELVGVMIHLEPSEESIWISNTCDVSGHVSGTLASVSEALSVSQSQL